MSDPFIEQLAHLCRQHPTRAKWVFVPSHAVGRVLGERLARSGTNWLNLHFVTPLDIALRMGAPFLVERGIDPSEEGLGPALVMRLLLALPEEGGYFRPLADQPMMAQALWRTIRELRMAGMKGHLKADGLPAGAFESPAKHAELGALLAAYEKYLVVNHRGDMATVYEEAVAHPDWCPMQAADCWTELPDVIWTPLQQRLLDIMPGERITPHALALPGVTVPRRLERSPATLEGPPVTHVERVTPDAAAHPLAFLLTPNAMPHASRAAGAMLHLYAAGGREAEIEETCRRILAAGVSLDLVEVVCSSSDHAALMWEKALGHDWPVTLGPGIPAASTRPGRALVGLCDWIETDFSAPHLRHLLQSGDMGLEKDDEGFTAGEAARTLMRAEAGWGRATYALALGGLRKVYETRAADPDLSDDDRELAREKSALTSAVLTWISGLLASIPEPAADGTVPLQRVVSAALAYLDRTTARSSQLDHRAAAALIDHVAGLQSLDGFACPLPTALRFIRERVLSLHVAPERPRPESLHICTVPQAGYSGRPHVFVVGLEEGRVFPAAIEDAVLLDRERAAISLALRRSADKIDEAVYAMLARLATCGATSTVTFSYSVRDTREFRETYGSWLMLQAFRLQQGNATATYHDMKVALGEPVSSIPPVRDRALSDSGWWLRTVVGSGAAGVDAVTATFAGLARGRQAEAARRSEAFTEFDGLVPDAGKALDPCASHNAFSVTDLEAAAGCPFRLFLKRGLGLRPVDERERDRDIWLDPLTRGSELHDIYAAALRRCRDAKRRPSLDLDAPWLRQLAEARLNALRREMPPATDEIFERESRDFLADVDLFLEGECEETSAELIGFEVSFGRPIDDEVEILARAEPVEILLGNGLTFRIAGRIDRIDKVGPSSFEILDYKTGSYYRSDWTGTFRGGRRLQHALYGLAAVELLRAKYKKPAVTGGVYYFSSRKGGRERVLIPAPTPAALAAVLADLRELIVNGVFVHAPNEGDCKFCDFKAACANEVHAQAEAKLTDPALAAYRRLGAHG
jgi:RecB family exonuclease